MSVPKPLPPCESKCPNRSVGCRTGCSKWAAYQIILVTDRKKRKEIFEKNVRSKQVQSKHYIPANEGSRI